MCEKEKQLQEAKTFPTYIQIKAFSISIIVLLCWIIDRGDFNGVDKIIESLELNFITTG